MSSLFAPSVVLSAGMAALAAMVFAIEGGQWVRNAHEGTGKGLAFVPWTMNDPEPAGDPLTFAPLSDVPAAGVVSEPAAALPTAPAKQRPLTRVLRRAKSRPPRLAVAAPVVRAPVEAPAESAAPAAPAMASAEDLNDFQAIHFALKDRFQLAVRQGLDTQERVATMDSQVEAPAAVVAAPLKKKARRNRPQATKVAAAPVTEAAPTDSQDQAISAALAIQAEPLNSQTVLDSQVPEAASGVAAAQATPISPAALPAEPAANSSIEERLTVQPEAREPSFAERAAEAYRSLDNADVAPTPSLPAAALAANQAMPVAGLPVAAANPVPGIQVSIPNQALPSMGGMDSQSVSIQLGGTAAPRQVGSMTVSLPSAKADPGVRVTMNTHVPTQDQGAAKLSPGPAGVTDFQEVGGDDSKSLLSTTPMSDDLGAIVAFDWSVAVPEAKSEVLSQEGLSTDGAQARPWVVTRANGFLSTVSHPLAGIPLMPENGARILARAKGIDFAPRMGIVFGRVPAGWKVELAGISQAAFYMDRTGAPLEVAESDRYFVFMGIAPGARLLKMVSVRDGRVATLAAPVLEGTATYLPLSQPTALALRGHVYDGTRADPVGLAGVEVRVVGQPDAVVVTDAKGAFSVPGVLRVGDEPLFLETAGADGYPHRYKVSAGAAMAGSVWLFRFPAARIRGWLSQLEGGVAADSGLIVGAVSSAVALSHEASAAGFPVTRSLGTPSSHLIPESYTLSGRDEVQAAAALTPESPRFLSVQVPEGGNVVSVEDQRGVRVWSEWVPTSPGVVSVVGPR